MKIKIAMYQSNGEYPSLHLMVTPNDRYHEARMCVDTVEEAMEKVELWLRKNYDQYQGKNRVHVPGSVRTSS